VHEHIFHSSNVVLEMIEDVIVSSCRVFIKVNNKCRNVTR
jgi:hypothetical protein